MKRLRFTIGELILVVIVVAIGLAAIRSGSAAWAGVDDVDHVLRDASPRFWASRWGEACGASTGRASPYSAGAIYS